MQFYSICTLFFILGTYVADNNNILSVQCGPFSSVFFLHVLEVNNCCQKKTVSMHSRHLVTRSKPSAIVPKAKIDQKISEQTGVNVVPDIKDITKCDVNAEVCELLWCKQVK